MNCRCYSPEAEVGQGFPYRVDTEDVQAWMEDVLGDLWSDIAP